MTLPLSGLTVVELGSSLAGPYSCRIFADLGAQVIKVEPPEVGDPARTWGSDRIGGASAFFQAINKEKRSVVSDFQKPGDVARLKKLLARDVDVVIQNLRPGVADRIGLGGEAVLELNPKIVYCNISAYGNEGPLKQLPGYDVLLQAFGGLVDVTGPADGPPARVGVPVIDIGTALWASIGVLGALHARSRTGRGAIVEAAMLDTALAWQSLGVAALEAGGEAPKRSGLKGPMVVPNTAFETADGLLCLTIGTDPQFRKLCQVIERPELADDARFALNPDRVANEAALSEIVETALRHRTGEHWSALLNAVDVPKAPVHSLAEAVSHAQTVACGVIQDSPGGDFRVVGCPLKFDGKRPGFRRQAPDLGEGTEEFLSPLS